jgi:uncharacterized membrane protein (UPF0136 family)
MTRTPFYLLIYSAILILGGISGYYKAGSMISLYAGLFSGIALGICSILMFLKKPFVPYVAFVLTLILTIVFAIRFSHSHAFHNIALCLLSAYVSFLCLLKVLKKDSYE